MSSISNKPAADRLIRRRGLTLVELMIAMVVLTVGVLGFIGSFGNIAKAIRYSKSRSLATNLAQEKIESLKNVSYHRLLVTQSFVNATEDGLGSFKYDDTYYPSEDLTVGEIDFQRRVFIEKINEDSGALQALTYDQPDMGLKRITAYVIWQDEDAWKKLSITNLIDNPSRQKIDATFSGTVTTDSGASPVDGATIVVLQNVQLKDQSDGSGDYEIDVSCGTYDLRATKRGYFSATLEATVASGENTDVDFDLVAMGSGTISGTVYLNNHVLITEVCPAIAGDEMVEFVQLYNQTSMQGVMDQGGSDPSYLVQYVEDGVGTHILNPVGETIYANSLFGPNEYYLIASTRIVSGAIGPAVKADAYYSDSNLGHCIPADRISTGWTSVGAGGRGSGAITVISQGLYEVAGTTVDAIGWGRSGGAFWPPPNAEGNGLDLLGAPGHEGIEFGGRIERMAFSTTTHTDMDLPGGGSYLQWKII